MKTLWNAADREEVRARARRLSPGAVPAWGQFNAPQMMAHVVDQLRMCTGRIRADQVKSPASYPVVKQLFVYVLPWPKGAPTLPELISRQAAEWGREVEELDAALSEFAARQGLPAGEWPVHPLFGRLSVKAWGRLGWRHIDHHFRQFGV